MKARKFLHIGEINDALKGYTDSLNAAKPSIEGSDSEVKITRKELVELIHKTKLSTIDNVMKILDNETRQVRPTMEEYRKIHRKLEKEK